MKPGGASILSEMVKNVRNSPPAPPSMRAASRTSVGDGLKGVDPHQVEPNGLIRDGMMTDHGVFVSPPIWLNMRNVGTARAVPGIATAPRTTAKTPRLPGKSNLASP